MRILLISIHYPPIMGMSSRAMAELSKAFVANGHGVDVLTIDPVAGHPVYKCDFAVMRHVPASVNVHRVAMGPFNRITARLLDCVSITGNGHARSIKSARQNGGDGHASVTRRAANRFYGARKLFQPFLIPDANIDWVPGALAEARRMIKNNSYDTMVSFGYPHTAHLVAYLARRNRHLPWAMVHAEGWGTSPGMEQLPGWSRNIHRKLDRCLSRAATRIVICGCAPGLLQRIPGAYDIDPGKLSLAQFAFVDLSDYTGTLPARRSNLHLVFTGAFCSETGQDPRELFNALKSLPPDQITFSSMGPPVEEFEKYAKRLRLHNVEFLGWQLHQMAIEFQKSAGALVVFGHGGGQQFPTKVYEYFAAKRPILCIAADDQDLVAQLVSRHRRGIVVPNSRDHIARALSRLLESHDKGTLESSFDLSDLPQYTSARSGAELMQAVLGQASGLKSESARPLQPRPSIVA